jgi:hypothetical protein
MIDVCAKGLLLLLRWTNTALAVVNSRDVQKEIILYISKSELMYRKLLIYWEALNPYLKCTKVDIKTAYRGKKVSKTRLELSPTSQ